MIKLNATITAVGGYIPEYVLTNKILETIEIDYETSIVISIEQGAIIVTEPYGQNQLAGKLPLLQ